MKHWKQSLYRQQQGAVLLVCLLLMLGMAIVAVKSTDSMQVQKQLAIAQKMNTQAFQAASGGVQWAINALNNDMSALLNLQPAATETYNNGSKGPYANTGAVNNQIDLKHGDLIAPAGYTLNVGSGFSARVYEIDSSAQVGSGTRQARSKQLQGVSLITPQG